jgi:colicin import membrane protein
MAQAVNHLEFAPPSASGTGQALSYALLAHLALVAALAWGVSWKRQSVPSAVEAELWSELPQAAAPKEVLASSPPPPPAPVVQEAPPAAKTPDIAVQKEKPKPEIKPEVKPDPTSEPKTEPKPDKAAERKLAEQKEKQTQEAREKEREAERQKNLERMAGLAGGTGAANSQGSAAASSGPSSGYAGLIKGRVRPNLVFTDSASGNPQVTVEVRMAPDGTILGRPRVLQSSGNREWDEAVVRAFEKTEVLPRDGGKVWSPLEIKWRVND